MKRTRKDAKEDDKFKKRRFTIDNVMPDDLSRKIARYLSDEDLFRMRKLNRVFRSAYYNQKIESQGNFNFHRALVLANQGAVFPKLTYFETDDWWMYHKFPAQAF